MTEHPITPPPELVRKWAESPNLSYMGLYRHIATQAARWGADQELKACYEWLQERISEGWNPCHLEDLHNARRPKPPSVKEQALLAIDTAVADGRLSSDVSNVVRRALEQLTE